MSVVDPVDRDPSVPATTPADAPADQTAPRGWAEPDGTPEPDGTRESNDQVITIGWQALLLPLLAVLVVGVGFWIGRQLRAPAQSAAPAAGSAPVADSAAPAGQQGMASSNVVEIQPEDLGITASQQGRPGYDSQTVYELPQRRHSLLGQEAPDFTLTLLGSGEEVSLSDYRGQPVMVNFWATWCPPCRYEMPWIESVHRKYEDQGLVVLAVDAGERVPPSLWEDTISRFVDSMGLTFPVLYGDAVYDIQREWQVLGLPSTYLLDEQGVVVDYHSGMYPNEVTLDAQLREGILAADGAETDAEPPAEG